MVFIGLLFAAGLWFCAYRTRDKGLRIFWFCAGLLNLIGALVAWSSNDPYAFKLRPADDGYEKDYRRP